MGGVADGAQEIGYAGDALGAQIGILHGPDIVEIGACGVSRRTRDDRLVAVDAARDVVELGAHAQQHVAHALGGGSGRIPFW